MDWTKVNIAAMGEDQNSLSMTSILKAIQEYDRQHVAEWHNLNWNVVYQDQPEPKPWVPKVGDGGIAKDGGIALGNKVEHAALRDLEELQATLAQEKQEREQERLEYAEILRQADDRLCDCDTTMPAGSRCCWCMDTCDHAIRKDVERIKADRAALAQSEAELQFNIECHNQYSIGIAAAIGNRELRSTGEPKNPDRVEIARLHSRAYKAEADKAVLMEALEEIVRREYPGASFLASEAIAKVTK